MKVLILLFFILFNLLTYSQDTISMWSFPSGDDIDSLPNYSNENNYESSLLAYGGTTVADYYRTGSTTLSATASEWENGIGTKYWGITLNTYGYKNLTLSSKISAAKNFPGPKDWKVQYALSNNGHWVDVNDSEFVCANDWTTGVLESLVLPEACNNQENLIIRWVITSDINFLEEEITVNSRCKIDDVIIKGSPIITSIENDIEENINIKVLGNEILIKSANKINRLNIFDINGRLCSSYNLAVKTIKISDATIQNGLFLFQVINSKGVFTKKYFIK